MKFSYYSYLERVCAEIAELEKLVANQTETDDPNGDNLTTLNQLYEIKNELLSVLIFVADRVNFLGKKEGTVVYQCDRFLVVDFDDGSHSVFDATNVHFLFKDKKPFFMLDDEEAMILCGLLVKQIDENDRLIETLERLNKQDDISAIDHENTVFKRLADRILDENETDRSEDIFFEMDELEKKVCHILGRKYTKRVLGAILAGLGGEYDASIIEETP